MTSEPTPGMGLGDALQAAQDRPLFDNWLLKAIAQASLEAASRDPALTIALVCKSNGVPFDPKNPSASLEAAVRAATEPTRKAARNRNRRERYHREKVTPIDEKRALYRRMGEIARQARAEWPEQVADLMLFNTVVECLRLTEGRMLRRFAATEPQRKALAESALKWCKRNGVLRLWISDAFRHDGA